MGYKYISKINGYCFSGYLKKYLDAEGYLVLRVVDREKSRINSCEVRKIEKGEILPEGANTVIEERKTTNYGRIILIDTDFIPGENVKKVEDYSLTNQQTN